MTDAMEKAVERLAHVIRGAYEEGARACGQVFGQQKAVDEALLETAHVIPIESARLVIRELGLVAVDAALLESARASTVTGDLYPRVKLANAVLAAMESKR